MKRINKIIVKRSVHYYSKAWKHRNEMLHNPEKYQYYMIEWYKNVINLIKHCNKPELCMYARAYKIDIDKCSTSYIRK